MKKIYILLTTILMISQLNVLSQAGFPYQAVLRTHDGGTINNQDIIVRFTIQNAMTDTIYQEDHQAKTNSEGHFALEIGKGTAIVSNFESIDWASESCFIKTEVNSGSGFAITGIQELLNVPYSQHAEEAGAIRTVTANGITYQLTVENSGKLKVIPFPEGYSKLVFQDEFDGEGLVDSDNWNYEYGYVRNPGTEMQFYTRERLENAFQKDGYLTLRCINNDTIRDAYGRTLNHERKHNGKTYYMSSASITTKGIMDWQYCRIEVRFKVPLGNDVWPAVWLLPTKPLQDDEHKNDIWPQSGEIDIMEYWGSNAGKFCYTLHSDMFNHTKPTGRGSSTTVDNPGDWHTIEFEWTEDSMEWFFDGESVYNPQKMGTGYNVWPFDNRFFLLINFAYENKKFNNLDKLPLDYQIDYIRVFEK